MVKKFCIAHVLVSKKGGFWAVGVCAGDMKTTWIELTEDEYNKLSKLPPLSQIDVKLVDIKNGNPVFNLA